MLGLSSRAPLPVTKSGTARKFDALASFPLRSVHKGFAGFGAVCLPALLPARSRGPALPSTQIPLKISPIVSKQQALQHPSATQRDKEKGLGGVCSLIGTGCPCPTVPGHAKLRGCSEQPQPCVHPCWGRRGCCYHLGGGTTFPQLAKIKLLALQKEDGPGQSSSRLPCHPSTQSAAEPAHLMVGYHRDPIPPGR